MNFLIVYLGHEIFHPVAFFIFLQIIFLGEILKLPN